MKKRILPTLSFLLGLLLLAAGYQPAAGEVTEYGVKAAFLYNFSQFVRWPDAAFASDDAPFVIGIVGEDPFGGALDEVVSTKSSGSHPISVKRFGGFTPQRAAALAKCQILFVSYSEKDQVHDILQALSGSKTLTVSDIENFPVKGGAIQFDQVGQKIGLVFNVNAAKKAGLSVSSQLLQVAKLYNPGE
jgi:hypothetical protein